MHVSPLGGTVAAAAIGLAAGLALAVTQSAGYRAGGAVVVAPALHRAGPELATLTHTAVELVRSPAVAQNVVQSLSLDESPAELLAHVRAHARPGTAIVDVTATAGSAVDAQRIAQQVVVVFQRLADARLGTQGSGPAISVWDTPSTGTERLGRPYAAWGIAGASLGLLLAAGLLFVPRRRPAGQPVSDTAPAVPRATVVEPPPPPPAAAPPPAARPGRRGLLLRLERRVEAEPDPARRAELLAYLDQLTGFADADGDLPPNFLSLVEDVFGVPVSPPGR